MSPEALLVFVICVTVTCSVIFKSCPRRYKVILAKVMRSRMKDKKEIFVIIETDNDGRYCSSVTVDNQDIADEMADRYRNGKQGFLHNYKIEKHYL